MRLLLELLGNPERKFKTVHVGGTAGKGSTATMIAAILQASGYRVGLHTKPHLHSVTERARIDMQPIGEQRFADSYAALLPVIEEMRAQPLGPPSYFELLVGLAFGFFSEEQVDVGVIEVGVGGTLDGTNVIVPEVSVLTNVGTDHKDILGDTVEQIAADKAGIIKRGVPIVTAAEQAPVLEIIRDAAAKQAAPLTILTESARISSAPRPDSYGQRTEIETSCGRYAMALPLIGRFQAVNAATAILALENATAAFPLRAGAIVQGLESVSLPGRAEYYPSRPALLFDVAHNVEKAQALGEALKWHFPGRRLIFVVAIAEEKDFGGMLDAWRSLPAQFIFTRFSVSHRESRHARNLANAAELRGLTARAVEEPVEALTVARRMAHGDDLVVATGSTFLVATLRQWFLENVSYRKPASV